MTPTSALSQPHVTARTQHLSAMDVLSDDLLIEIACQLEIDDFFAMRQASKRFYDVTSIRIISVVEKVAQNTFPHQTWIFSRAPGERIDVAWLNNLRYRQLAAIVLECAKDSQIRAEDPFGDRLRAKIETGWKVLYQLARVTSMCHSRAAHETPSHHLPENLDTLVNSVDPASALFMQNEYSIPHHWKEHARALSVEEIQGVSYILEALLHRSTFYYPQIDEDLFAARGPDPRDPTRKFALISWVIWSLFKMGPRVFWRQWWAQRSHNGRLSSQGTSLNTLLIQHGAWKSTQVKEAEYRTFISICQLLRNAQAEKIYQVEHTRGAPLSRHRVAFFDSLDSRAKPLARERRRRTSQGEVEPAPTMTGVCFQQTLQLDSIPIETHSQAFRRMGGRYCDLYISGRLHMPTQAVRDIRVEFEEAIEYEEAEAAWLIGSNL